MVFGIVMVVTCWSSGSDLTAACLLVFKPLLEFMLASVNTVRHTDIGRFVPQWPVDFAERLKAVAQVEPARGGSRGAQQGPVPP